MTEAEQVAWEQVRHWRVFLTAAEAARALHMTKAATWDDIARRLALLWLDLQGDHDAFKRAA